MRAIKLIFVSMLFLMIGNDLKADDNIVVVLDTSGSMGTGMRGIDMSRMTVAKLALLQELWEVPASTKIGIVTFDGWIYDLGPVEKERLKKAVLSMVPSGGTPLYEYMKMGADRLLSERQKQNNVGFYKLLVVTDGEAGDNYLNEAGSRKDGSKRPGYLQDILNRGIVVDVIGFAMANDHSLKTQINGTYMRGDDPSSIRRSLRKSVAEVGFIQDESLTAEAFQEIGKLPTNFVKSSLEGLTKFQNQPIGEDGKVETTSSNAPSPQGSTQGSLDRSALVSVVLLGLCLCVVIAVVIINGIEIS